jgi:N-acetylglucosamine-6-phosphate deacetylase
MAGAFAALAPWTGRASGETQGAENALAGTKRTVELPGLFDLQVNGFAGVDFGDAALSSESVLEAVAAIGKTGVTRFLPTLITSSIETFSACARTIARTSHPAIAGIHMEGPYISPEDGPRGAHARAFVRGADVDDFRRRQEAAAGRIRLLTVAPEAPGVLPVIEHAVGSGVRVAIGHTGATPAQIADAVGPPRLTHLRQRLCAGAAAPPPTSSGSSSRTTASWPASSWTGITCRPPR